MVRGTLITVCAIVAVGLALAAAWWELPGEPAAPRENPRASIDSPPATHRGPYRVLMVISYNIDWAAWSGAEYDAFRRALADLDVEYKVVELDALRDNNPKHIDARLDEARRIIADWKPDLVYVSDDAALDRLAVDCAETDLPFVFSGINGELADNGLDKAANVTGVLEREHIRQTVELAKQLIPQAKRLAVIADPNELWPDVLRRFRELGPQLTMEIVDVDRVSTFAEYEEKMRQYQRDGIDVICRLGAADLTDADGHRLSMVEATHWAYDHTPFPMISLYDCDPQLGALCAVTVSGKAQGEAAGRIARGILADGKLPSDYPVMATTVGRPVINLSVARHFGIMPSSTLLLSSEVIQDFDW